MNLTSICLATIYTGASAWMLVGVVLSTVSRERRLLWPAGINALVASAILISAIFFPTRLLSISPFGPGHYEIYVILLAVLLFALAIEVPGYLLNVAYDKRKEVALAAIADALLDVRFDPNSGNRERLRDAAQKHLATLKDDHSGTYIVRCTEQLMKLPSGDSRLVDFLIEHVARERGRISDQSKYPFPVLIETFSLSAVAFVLAEILAVLRAK